MSTATHEESSADAPKPEPILRLAVLHHPHVAIEDHCGELCVFFDAFIDEAEAALQVIRIGDPHFYSVWEAMAGDVKKLDGKTCWVRCDDHMIRFVRMAAI